MDFNSPIYKIKYQNEKKSSKMSLNILHYSFIIYLLKHLFKN